MSEIHLAFLDQLGESIGIVLSTITANMRAEDLVQEQAARAEAEYGLARLRQVVDVMPEAILIADATGRVYLSNAAAAEIMGTVPETVSSTRTERPAPGAVDGGAYLPADHPLARAVFHSEVVRGEQLVITNAITGREVPILVNSAPLSDGQGHPAGGVAVFQDISPLRDLDRQKDEFLAAISHDLKTPATIIKGNANLLQRAIARGDREGSTADRRGPRGRSTRARPSSSASSTSCSISPGCGWATSSSSTSAPPTSSRSSAAWPSSTRRSARATRSALRDADLRACSATGTRPGSSGSSPTSSRMP